MSDVGGRWKVTRFGRSYAVQLIGRDRAGCIVRDEEGIGLLESASRDS